AQTAARHEQRKAAWTPEAKQISDWVYVTGSRSTSIAPEQAQQRGGAPRGHRCRISAWLDEALKSYPELDSPGPDHSSRCSAARQPPERRRRSRTTPESVREPEEVFRVDRVQVCRIFVRCHAVDARRTILAGEPVRLLHPFQIDDVV